MRDWTLRVAAASALAAALLFAGALAGEAKAAVIPITALRAEPASLQAGAHSDTVARLGFSDISEIDPCDCHVVKDVFVNTPPGVVGTPTNIPTCSETEITSAHCPVDSQIGMISVHFWQVTDFSSGNTVPIYNMEPSPNELARIAFPVPGSASNSINISVVARTESDYGLEFHTFGIPRILPTSGFTQYFWGVPGDPVNDKARLALNVPKRLGCPGNQPDIIERMLAQPSLCKTENPPVASNAALTPFLSNPTACNGPLRITGAVLGYDNETTTEEATFPALTGCDQLSFDPSLSAKPTTTEADAPSGLDINLTVPQKLSPGSLTPSAIRDLTVVLPPGFSVNSNAADGKTSCTDAEANFGTRKAAECPQNSKIGTLEVESSSLPSLLPGAMYLGKPLPGERYRAFVAFDGFSLHVKLPGTVYLDPATGQVKFTFKDLPEFNFQRFNAHVFGAERGLFSTPTQCGTYPVEATFRPWAYPDLAEQTSTQFFTIDSGPGGTPCPPAKRPFNPAMATGVTDNTGGAHTGFVFDLTRRDGDQDLTATNVTLPPGFSGILAGIPYCPDATLAALAQSSYLGATELTSPSCPASRLGSAVAGGGAGSRPVSLPGSVYLAGPYKGEPLSLAVVIPVVSGPYDLGNVVTRVALHVDPVTAQVTALSDQLPQIIEGVPARLRRVLVDLDRPDFAINPTNCSPLSVSATAFGDQGAQSSLSNHFQVANCGALPYEPKLSLKLRGGVNRLGHPAIHSVFTAAPGEANTRRVALTLPSTEFLDNAHINTICTRVDFAKENCPAGSLIGTAEARTPILENPLKGNVYLRSNPEHELPDLAVALKGQVSFELAAHIDSAPKGGLRTRFETVPDVPVSSFTLDLAGGSKGLLQNSTGLCGRTKRATTQMVGQNGAELKTKTKLDAACGKAKRKRASHSHRGRRHKAHASTAGRAGR